MTTVYYHKHHKIPKHVFKLKEHQKDYTEEQISKGVDHPDNIEKLTVTDHAEAHHQLFLKYGRWQDKLAWLSLSKQIGKQEIIRRIAIINGKKHKGQKLTSEHKQKISESSKGKVISPEHRRKLSESRIGSVVSQETKNKIGDWHRGKIITLEHRKKTSASMKGIKRQKVKCPHCDKIGAAGNMHRWHFENCKQKVACR